MMQHSNKSPAAQLAQRLYEEGDNKVKPTWEQLKPYGGTQSYWIAQAEKLMQLQPLEQA
jgi:hypothetical protein